MRAGVLASLFVVIAASVVDARPWDPAALRAISATPEAPRFELSVDAESITTGRFATMAHVLHRPRGRGLFVALLPLAETEGYIIPYQRWRGRLTLEVGYDLPMGDDLLVVTGGLEHESDHHTVEPNDDRGPVERPIAVVLNNALLRVDWMTARRRERFVLTGLSRLHLVTCTVPDRDCWSGTEGNATAEGAIEALWTREREDAGGFVPFASVAANWMARRRLAGGERRVELRGGVRQVRGWRGDWQFAVWSRHGSPADVFRGVRRDEHRVGVSVGFAR